METFIGIAIWVVIFVVWYVKNYPEKFRGMLSAYKTLFKRPRRPNAVSRPMRSMPSINFKGLVESIETTCAMDRFNASDAAAMVEAVKQIMEMEPGSGQIWEAYALDSLESAEIICDDCKVPVDKMIKKTGLKIQCRNCGKWLALKNSKVTILDPHRSDIEDWEK
jgi:hypothetical protein